MCPSKRLIYSSFGSFLFGLVFLLCGIIQTTAGIAFLLVLKKILMTASNIWIGILNSALGLVWIKIAEKKQLRINIGICLGLTFINLGNLLLMELGEWRAFLPANLLMSFIKDGRINLLKTAYLSTMIPTVIAFIVALVACQYILTLIILRMKKVKKVSVPNFIKLKDCTVTVSRHFRWVFNEQQQGLENELHLNTATSSPLYVAPILEETPTRVVTFRPALCFLSESENQDDPHFVEEPELCGGEEMSTSETSPLPVRIQVAPIASPNADGKHTPALFKIATIRRHPFNAQFLGTLPNGYPYEIGNPENLSENNKQSTLSLSNVTPPAAAPSPPSSSKSQNKHDSQAKRFSFGIFDVDSLVHLTELELMARQWRFQHQHKAIERKVSLRLANSRMK